MGYNEWTDIGKNKEEKYYFDPEGNKHVLIRESGQSTEYPHVHEVFNSQGHPIIGHTNNYINQYNTTRETSFFPIVISVIGGIAALLIQAVGIVTNAILSALEDF